MEDWSVKVYYFKFVPTGLSKIGVTTEANFDRFVLGNSREEKVFRTYL